jgi:uncharacterized membrane protein
VTRSARAFFPPSARSRTDALKRSTFLLGALFLGAGVTHFLAPKPFEAIVPPWLPNAPLLVRVSGVAEILGGIGVWLPATRRAAGLGLVILLVAVFPANVEMLRQARAAEVSVTCQAALWIRLPLQIALLWWVWRDAVGSRRSGGD